MKILIIKPSALGDIVWYSAHIFGSRRQWPDAQIDWMPGTILLREIFDSAILGSVPVDLSLSAQTVDIPCPAA